MKKRREILLYGAYVASLRVRQQGTKVPGVWSAVVGELIKKSPRAGPRVSQSVRLSVRPSVSTVIDKIG